MPNHVDNELVVKGKSGVKEFYEFMEGIDKGEDGKEEKNLFDCNKIIPYPEKWRKADEVAREYDQKLYKLATIEERKAFMENNPRPTDGYNSGGYQWCIDNWGTKWGAYDVERTIPVGKEDKEVFYRFNTAWSTCEPVITALSKRFPELTFTLKYWEGGMGFKGVLKMKDGLVLKEEEGSYRGNRGG